MAEKKMNIVVVKAFRDKNDHVTRYAPGQELSFAAERAENLISRGLAVSKAKLEADAKEAEEKAKAEEAEEKTEDGSQETEASSQEPAANSQEPAASGKKPATKKK